MTHLDDVRALIELACTVDDRSDAEQRALLRVAMRADQEANQATVTNRREGEAWRLHQLAEYDQSVKVSPDARKKLDKRADAWDALHSYLARQ